MILLIEIILKNKMTRIVNAQAEILFTAIRMGLGKKLKLPKINEIINNNPKIKIDKMNHLLFERNLLIDFK